MNIRKTLKDACSLVKVCTLVAVGAGALVLSQGSYAQSIQGSKHDLGSGGTSQFGATGGGSAEVCVFCHTPHGSDTSASVPLWNKALGVPGDYTRYSTLGTVTLDGTDIDTGSVSLACLSCHDGTQAMDAVINAPGSGGYNVAGLSIPGGSDLAMTGTPIPVLGTDLTDDHPIGIQYGGGGCTVTTPGCTGGVTVDPDFNVPLNDVINGTTVWWVDEDANGIRSKTDMILYTRTDATAANEPEPFVECGSCHDPHNSDTLDVTPGSESVAFLRIRNDASAVCLACHDK